MSEERAQEVPTVTIRQSHQQLEHSAASARERWETEQQRRLTARLHDSASAAQREMAAHAGRVDERLRGMEEKIREGRKEYALLQTAVAELRANTTQRPPALDRAPASALLQPPVPPLPVAAPTRLNGAERAVAESPTPLDDTALSAERCSSSAPLSPPRSCTATPRSPSVGSLAPGGAPALSSPSSTVGEASSVAKMLAKLYRALSAASLPSERADVQKAIRSLEEKAAELAVAVQPTQPQGGQHSGASNPSEQKLSEADGAPSTVLPVGLRRNPRRGELKRKADALTAAQEGDAKRSAGDDGDADVFAFQAQHRGAAH